MVHRCQNSDRLERHRLATGVWSRDQQHALRGTELQVNWDNGAEQEWVSGTAQRQQVITP